MNWVRKQVAVFVLVKYEFIYFMNIFKKYDCEILLKLLEYNDIKLIKIYQFLRIYLNS